MVEDKKEYVVIRFPKPRNMERFVWILLVLVLAGLVFWNPFKAWTSDSGVNGAMSAATDSVVNTSVEVKSAEVKPEPVKVETPKVVPKEEVKVPEPTPVVAAPKLSGIFGVEISNIVQDKPADASYVKVRGVDFKLDNGKSDLNVLLQAQIYKDSDTDIQKEKIRGETNVPIKSGKLSSGQIPISSGTWLPGDTLNVVITAKDFDSDEVLTKKKVQFKLS